MACNYANWPNCSLSWLCVESALFDTCVIYGNLRLLGHIFVDKYSWPFAYLNGEADSAIRTKGIQREQEIYGAFR